MTREKAIVNLECMAIEITGKIATEKSKVLEGYLEAIDTAQEALRQPTADEIIRKCAEAVAYISFCDNCEYYSEVGAVCVCDGKNCVETTEEVLREKVLNNV